MDMTEKPAAAHRGDRDAESAATSDAPGAATANTATPNPPTTEDVQPSPRQSLTSRRTRGLAVIVAVAIAAAGGGVLGAHWIKSPAQLAAESSAPPPSVITAPVERRVVSSGMVTRGTVGSLSTINAVPTQHPSGVAEALVTKLPAKAGTTLKPGDVVMEISGRPVFYLPGRIPAYRDLQPGATGPDVTQLQQALTAAGFSDDDESGHYGPDTATAVAALFTSHGYTPQGKGSLPMSSVDYVNSPTSTIVTLNASLGQEAAKADVELAAGDLVVLVDQTPASGELMRTGAQVELTAEILNQTAAGTITKILPGKAGADPTAVVTPDKPLEPRWAGEDVRVQISRASSKGKVLAVPVSAISMSGEGEAKVVVVHDGKQSDVPVTVGATGGGYAQVTPTGSAQISEGDRVIVGAQ